MVNKEIQKISYTVLFNIDCIFMGYYSLIAEITSQIFNCSLKIYKLVKDIRTYNLVFNLD